MKLILWLVVSPDVSLTSSLCRVCDQHMLILAYLFEMQRLSLSTQKILMWNIVQPKRWLQIYIRSHFQRLNLYIYGIITNSPRREGFKKNPYRLRQETVAFVAFIRLQPKKEKEKYVFGRAIVSSLTLTNTCFS